MSIFENDHLSEQALSAFFGGTLSESESLAVAEHVSCCSDCAEALACMPDESCKEAPKGFESFVRYRVNAHRQRELADYSLKICITVAAAAAFALFMPVRPLSAESYSAPLPAAITAPAPKEPEKNWIGKLSEKFDSIINLEDLFHDSAKK